MKLSVITETEPHLKNATSSPTRTRSSMALSKYRVARPSWLMQAIGLVSSGSPLADTPPPPPRETAPAPPSPPAPPHIVSQADVQAQMISGDKRVHPDGSTRTMMLRDGKTRLVSIFKLCVSAAGKVASVQLMRSTGYRAYDGKLEGAMRTWKFRPFMVDGRAVPICSVYTFIYDQKN